MFIYTVKANTLKFVAVVIAAVLVLVSIALISDRTDVLTTQAISVRNKDINYEKIKTEEDRRKFLAQFGWETEDGEVESVTIKLPGEFDRIMTEYNELQKSQGLDLHKFKGREVERYTYKVTNYPEYDGVVLANVIIYRNRVIGGDLCSSDVAGFIHGFDRGTVAEG